MLFIYPAMHPCCCCSMYLMAVAIFSSERNSYEEVITCSMRYKCAFLFLLSLLTPSVNSHFCEVCFGFLIQRHGKDGKMKTSHLVRVVLHGKKNNINDILHRSGVAIKAQTVNHVWQSAVKTTALFVLLCLSWIRSLAFSLCAGESAMRRSFRVWGHGLHLGQAGVGRAQRWGGTRQGLQQRRRLHRSVRERMSIKSSLLHFTQLIAQRGPITPPAHTIYILIVTAHGTSAECKVLQFRQ